MGTHRVIYTDDAVRQLVAIDEYLAAAGVAESNFVANLVAYCDSLETFPDRGRDRSDLLPGLKTIGYKRRVLIAYQTTNDTVIIAGVFYGGQDYEHRLIDRYDGMDTTP